MLNFYAYIVLVDPDKAIQDIAKDLVGSSISVKVYWIIIITCQFVFHEDCINAICHNKVKECETQEIIGKSCSVKSHITSI